MVVLSPVLSLSIDFAYKDATVESSEENQNLALVLQKRSEGVEVVIVGANLVARHNTPIVLNVFEMHERYQRCV